MPKKSKFATVILSAVPGLGHMYLGWQQRGLQFMLTFFLMIFLMAQSGGLSLFTFLLPVIWFYSLFDALQCYEEIPPPREKQLDSWHWVFQKQKWVGIGLIVIGGLLLINKVAFPMLLGFLDYAVIRSISTIMVALLLIAGGIRLAWGKPIPPPPRQEEKTSQVTPSVPEEKVPAQVPQPPAAEERPILDKLPQGEENE